MGTLSYRELRHLVRLHHVGIDGADDELLRIATRSDELCEVLRFPRANLERLKDAEDPVALLVATIEGAPRLRRDAASRSRRESARGLAETLCVVSERRPDGDIALHGPLLAEILSLWGAGWIVLGERGSVEAPRLRAILRECRAVRATAVVLTQRELFIAYETDRSRGLFRLHLNRVVHDAGALYVPIEQVPTRPIDTTDPPLPLAEQIEQSSAFAGRRSSRRPRRSFIHTLVEVALAAALGAWP